ncbi:hypothetical protein ACLK1Y_08970 [Escherichia coli]
MFELPEVTKTSEHAFPLHPSIQVVQHLGRTPPLRWH